LVRLEFDTIVEGVEDVVEAVDVVRRKLKL
jgi:hypothetical protein